MTGTTPQAFTPSGINSQTGQPVLKWRFMAPHTCGHCHHSRHLSANRIIHRRYLAAIRDLYPRFFYFSD